MTWYSDEHETLADYKHALAIEQRLAKLDAGGYVAKKERSRLHRARNLEAKLAEQRKGMSNDCGWCGANYPEKCEPASCEGARRDEAYYGR